MLILTSGGRLRLRPLEQQCDKGRTRPRPAMLDADPAWVRRRRGWGPILAAGSIRRAQRVGGLPAAAAPQPEVDNLTPVVLVPKRNNSDQTLRNADMAGPGTPGRSVAGPGTTGPNTSNCCWTHFERPVESTHPRHL